MNVRFGSEILAAATAHHLDPRLLAAVAAQETGGPGSDSGRNIVGDAGHGRGVFQIDDRSWSFARTPAAMDPAKNADMAASILADNLGRYGGDVRAALSAYNAGSPRAAGTATTWADGSTLDYADSVLRHYGQLGADVQAQLVADKGETAGSVNALAAFGSSRPASSAALPAAVGAPQLTPAPLSLVRFPSYATVPGANFQGSVPSADDPAGADADSRMATIVGGDDATDGADDATDGADSADGA